MKQGDVITKFFLDSGDPEETRQALAMLGHIDGQTTNPSLVAKNPEVKKRLEQGRKFTQAEISAFYKEMVVEISRLIPKGSVSIEVYCDRETRPIDIIGQAEEMFAWISNAHIKIPITVNGLIAAQTLARLGIRLNMTLCFSQQQAAAVYAVTQGRDRGDIFLSPFIGRFDDRGENGMDFIANVQKMLKPGDGHVEVIAASIRNLDHFLACLQMKTDIVTVPFRILKEWADGGMKPPADDYVYNSSLKPIQCRDVVLEDRWQNYCLSHELTTQGMAKFIADWKSMIV